MSLEPRMPSLRLLLVRLAPALATSLLTATALPFDRLDDGVRLHLEASGAGARHLTVRVLSDDVVQVLASAEPGAEPAGLVLDERRSLAKAIFRVEETGDVLQIVTAHLRIRIARATGRVTFADAHGAALLAEGPRRIVPTVAPNETKAYQVQQGFQWASDEALYGLEQHQGGVFDRRGHYVELAQHNRRAVCRSSCRRRATACCGTTPPIRSSATPPTRRTCGRTSATASTTTSSMVRRPMRSSGGIAR